MQLREKVTVPGLEGTWTTNLTDDDLRRFHALHGGHSPTDQIRVGLFTTSITIGIITTTVPFRDGACLWYGVNDRRTVIFRTHQEWEIWEARKRELDELRQEQALRQAIERQLFRTEDHHLFTLASGAQARRDYEAAASCYCARAELRGRFPGIGCCSVMLVEDTLMRFSVFPSSSYGIAYLRDYHPRARYFQRFADAFRFWSLLPAPKKRAEIEQIYDEAVRLFPDDGDLFKHACLFWRRERRLELALKYCRIAAERALSDDTKSGFVGRLRRLTREYERAA
jgi:hypothetical protein